MPEPLRVRSYRLYCEAKKLANAPGLGLADFDQQHRRLQREYADVFASHDASSHAELVSSLLRAARAELRAAAKRAG
jgi:hypothetical protein